MKQRAIIKKCRAETKKDEITSDSKKLQRAIRRLEKEKKAYNELDEFKKKKVDKFDDQHNILEASSVIGAFVVFNNEQSRARCLVDYAGSENWFWRMTQIPPLRFQQKYKLTVTKARLPGDVVWENMEETCCSVCVRRTVTMIASLILIIGAAVPLVFK
mgnify:FL=1